MPNARVVQMTYQEYRDHPAINQSSIKSFREDSLAHDGLERGIFPKPESTGFQFGKDLEHLVFYGSLPLVIIPPEVLNDKGHRRNRAGQTQWTDFVAEAEAEHPGAELVTEEEYTKRLGGVSFAMENLRKHPKAQALLLDRRNCQYHTVIFWNDAETGVECKCEIDVIHRAGTIVDLKSSRVIKASEFAKQIWSFRYDVQAVWYRTAVHELTGSWLPFVFLVVKNCPGYGVEAFTINDEFLIRGQETITEWLPKLVEAQRTNDYRPDTWGMITQLEPPGWAKYEAP